MSTHLHSVSISAQFVTTYSSNGTAKLNRDAFIEGLPPDGLVVGAAVVGFAVVGAAVVGFGVVGAAVGGFGVVGAAVGGFGVVGAAVGGFGVVGAAVGGFGVVAGGAAVVSAVVCAEAEARIVNTHSPKTRVFMVSRSVQGVSLE